MKKITVSLILSLSIFLNYPKVAIAQKAPTGEPKDFSVKTCLHSVSYAGFWRGQAKLTVDDFLLKAKELGFDGVQLVAKRPHVSPLDYDENDRKKLKTKIKQLGLQLVCLAGYTDFTAGVDKAGVPHVEIQAMYVGEIAKLAHDLGTNMVRIFTGYIREGIPYDKQYNMVLEGLRLAGKEAAKYDVMLAVQNHHDIGLHHEEMYWLINDVNLSNVKVAWDAWSPTLEGLSSAEIKQAILKMTPYIVHTTVADYIKLPQYRYRHQLTNYIQKKSVIRAVPVGEGIIDYKTFIETLKKIGYQGYISYEMCEVLQGGGSIKNLDEAAKTFLHYVRQFE